MKRFKTKRNSHYKSTLYKKTDRLTSLFLTISPLSELKFNSDRGDSLFSEAYESLFKLFPDFITFLKFSHEPAL